MKTLPMKAMPEFGYDPVPLIVSGEKTHTLRGRRCQIGAVAEVTSEGHRTGVIVRFVKCERMTAQEYCTDDFAWADGVRPVDARAGEAMQKLVRHFYGGLPDRWRWDFEIAEE